MLIIRSVLTNPWTEEDIQLEVRTDDDAALSERERLLALEALHQLGWTLGTISAKED